jgi:hypothetical protein
LDCTEGKEEPTAKLSPYFSRGVEVPHILNCRSELSSGQDCWSLTLREERRLRVSENRVVMRIFGAKRDEVAGDWRRLRNEELYDLCFSPDIIQVITSGSVGWAGHVERIMEKRGAYRVLVGKPEGKVELGIRSCVWEGNIKMNLEEVGWGSMD